MKYTLLDMTQTILSRMDSDTVNSISDTPESMQVATLIRTSFFDIAGRANLPEQRSPFTLEASTDPAKPTLMTLPNNVIHLDWIRYDWQTASDPIVNMRKLDFIPFEDFLDRMYSMANNSNTGTFLHTVESSPVTFIYRNDKAPDYYTTFDDQTVIFDSYDSSLDMTLQKVKTLCYGSTTSPFVLSDFFIPDLDDQQFALLLSEATALAWAELKQTSNQKAEQSARRNWVSLQKNKNSVRLTTDFDNLPNFGRK